MATPAAHTLRIIGGRWRGRRVAVNSAEGLRPTPNRIRETLFNWLAPRIDGARCLDMFAGTGALGLEALSRGAAHVTFVERDAANVHTLNDALAALDCDSARVVQGNALNNTFVSETGYDVIFIDPPFAAHLHAAALAAVEPLIKPGTRVYMEYPATQTDQIVEQLPPAWQSARTKRAGRVGYSLLYRVGERL